MGKRTPNDNQRRAIAWVEGPLLVLAGPGAGKTFVLTERVIRLIRTSPESCFQVLALTFTNRAAATMKDRVGNRLGEERRRVEIATFHSFCIGILRQHGAHIGLRTDFRILTQEADRVAILRDLERRGSIPGAAGLAPEQRARLLGRLIRSGRNDAARPLEAADAPPALRTGEWVTSYVEYLIAENCLDFDSLLACCLRLFRKNPAVLALVRASFPHVLVDEYQDTNAAQDRLLRLLCPPPLANLFVVADDDQIIHEWNGASPARLDALRSDYRMKIVELPESYRCPAETLGLANRLIAQNRARLPGRTPVTGVASGPRSEIARVREFPDETREAAWISRDFVTRSIPSAESVVLARSSRLLGEAYREFERLGIPVFRVERKTDFESPGVRFVSAALRLAAASADMEQLRRLCKAFFETTGVPVPVDDAATIADLDGGALLAGFTRAARAPASPNPLAAALVEIARRLLVERLDYREFLRETFSIFESEDPNPVWTDEIDASTLREVRRWRALDAAVSGGNGADIPLSRFLRELDLQPIVREPLPDEVRCLTIHQAKGEEFEHVYLMGLAEDQLPSYFAKTNGEHGPRIEEERRTCFVAITRASGTLTLTYAKSYFGWTKAPSRFLSEMGLPTQ